MRSVVNDVLYHNFLFKGSLFQTHNYLSPTLSLLSPRVHPVSFSSEKLIIIEVEFREQLRALQYIKEQEESKEESSPDGQPQSPKKGNRLQQINVAIKDLMARSKERFSRSRTRWFTMST